MKKLMKTAGIIVFWLSLITHTLSLNVWASQLCTDCFGNAPGMWCLDVTADGAFAYVGFEHDDALLIVDLNTFNAIENIDVSAAGPLFGSFGCRLTPNENKLWFAKGPKYAIVDTTTREFERLLNINPGNTCIHFNSDGSKAYLVDRYSDNFYIVNTSDYTYEILSVPGFQFGIFFPSTIDPNRIYGVGTQISIEGYIFYQLDIPSASITRSTILSTEALPENFHINKLIINTAETQAYIGSFRFDFNRGEGNIVAFDLDNFEILSWTPVENGIQDMALNEPRGKIYSIGFWSGGAHPDSHPITEWDIATRTVSGSIMVSPASDQRAIIIDPTDSDYLYMTEGDYNLLRKVHIPTGQEVNMIKFNIDHLSPMRVYSTNDIGYVTCLDSRTVFKLDLNTGKLVGSFFLPPGILGMTEGGFHQGYLYFPWDDVIYQIDPLDGSVEQIHQLSRTIMSGQMTFFNDKAVIIERYEGGTTGKSLTFINTSTMDIIEDKTIDLPATEHSDKVFLSPGGTKLYDCFGTATTTIQVISTSTLDVVKEIVVPTSDSYISKVSNNADGYFDVDTRRFYLTGWGAVFVIDMDTDELVDVWGTTEESIDNAFGMDVAFTGLAGISMNPDKDKLLVSSLDTGKMIVYDLTQNTWLTEVIQLGGYFTSDETSSSDNQYIYTINRETDNISVVNATTRQLEKVITLVEAGDVNRDDSVDLADADIVLKILTGSETPFGIRKEADVNFDGTLGLEDLTYILQMVSDLR